MQLLRGLLGRSGQSSGGKPKGWSAMKLFKCCAADRVSPEVATPSGELEEGALGTAEVAAASLSVDKVVEGTAVNLKLNAVTKVGTFDSSAYLKAGANAKPAQNAEPHLAEMSATLNQPRAAQPSAVKLQVQDNEEVETQVGSDVDVESAVFRDGTKTIKQKFKDGRSMRSSFRDILLVSVNDPPDLQRSNSGSKSASPSRHLAEVAEEDGFGSAGALPRKSSGSRSSKGLKNALDDGPKDNGSVKSMPEQRTGRASREGSQASVASDQRQAPGKGVRRSSKSLHGDTAVDTSSDPADLRRSNSYGGDEMGADGGKRASRINSHNSKRSPVKAGSSKEGSKPAYLPDKGSSAVGRELTLESIVLPNNWKNASKLQLNPEEPPSAGVSESSGSRRTKSIARPKSRRSVESLPDDRSSVSERPQLPSLDRTTSSNADADADETATTMAVASENERGGVSSTEGSAFTGSEGRNVPPLTVAVAMSAKMELDHAQGASVAELVPTPGADQFFTPAYKPCKFCKNCGRRRRKAQQFFEFPPADDGVVAAKGTESSERADATTRAPAQEGVIGVPKDSPQAEIAAELSSIAAEGAEPTAPEPERLSTPKSVRSRMRDGQAVVVLLPTTGSMLEGEPGHADGLKRERLDVANSPSNGSAQQLGESDSRMAATASSMPSQGRGTGNLVSPGSDESRSKQRRASTNAAPAMVSSSGGTAWEVEPGMSMLTNWGPLPSDAEGEQPTLQATDSVSDTKSMVTWGSWQIESFDPHVSPSVRSERTDGYERSDSDVCPESENGRIPGESESEKGSRYGAAEESEEDALDQLTNSKSRGKAASVTAVSAAESGGAISAEASAVVPTETRARRKSNLGQKELQTTLDDLVKKGYEESSIPEGANPSLPAETIGLSQDLVADVGSRRAANLNNPLPPKSGRGTSREPGLSSESDEFRHIMSRFGPDKAGEVPVVLESAQKVAQDAKASDSAAETTSMRQADTNTPGEASAAADAAPEAAVEKTSSKPARKKTVEALVWMDSPLGQRLVPVLTDFGSAEASPRTAVMKGKTAEPALYSSSPMPTCGCSTNDGDDDARSSTASDAGNGPRGTDAGERGGGDREPDAMPAPMALAKTPSLKKKKSSKSSKSEKSERKPVAESVGSAASEVWEEPTSPLSADTLMTWTVVSSQMDESASVASHYGGQSSHRSRYGDEHDDYGYGVSNGDSHVGRIEEESEMARKAGANSAAGLARGALETRLQRMERQKQRRESAPKNKEQYEAGLREKGLPRSYLRRPPAGRASY